jgi:hypothetical protein
MAIAGNTIGLIRTFFNRSRSFPQPEVMQSLMGPSLYPSYGGTAAGGMGPFATNNSEMQNAMQINNDLLSRYSDYEDMSYYPEIFTALNIYSDEATQEHPLKGKCFWIDAEDQTITDILEYTFHKQLGIDDLIWGITRTLCKYGNVFYELIVQDGMGIIKLIKHKVPYMRRIQDEQGNCFGFMRDPSMSFKIDTQEFLKRLYQGESSTFHPQHQQDNIKVFEPWEIAHFRLESDEHDLYGIGIAEGGRWAWKRLQQMEDAMVVFKLTRSPQRYAFYVDVGDVPPNEGRKILNQVKQDFKKQKLVDPVSGKMNLRYNPLCLSTDTTIPLLNNQVKSLSELIADFNNGIKNYVYSIDRENQIVVPGEISWAGITKKNTQVVRVNLDNGESFTCTPEHKVVVRDGSYVEAQDLLPGQSLMPFTLSSADHRKVISVEFIEETIDTGCITVEGHHNFGLECGVFVKNSSDEDFFLAKRKGERSTEIEVLSGLDGQSVDDTQYFRDKLISALAVPKAYLGYDETIGRANLGQMDIRMAKTVLRIQKAVKNGLKQIGDIDLASRNIDPQSVEYSIGMTVPSGALEVAHIEVQKLKCDLAASYQGLAFSEYYIWSQIMGLSDEEIEEIQDQRVAELTMPGKQADTGGMPPMGGSSPMGDMPGGEGDLPPDEGELPPEEAGAPAAPSVPPLGTAGVQTASKYRRIKPSSQLHESRGYDSLLNEIRLKDVNLARRIQEVRSLVQEMRQFLTRPQKTQKTKHG